MQYLNNTFWRMIIGFLAVIIVALGLLYLSISYDKRGSAVPVENYLAGSDSEVGN